MGWIKAKIATPGKNRKQAGETQEGLKTPDRTTRWPSLCRSPHSMRAATQDVALITACRKQGQSIQELWLVPPSDGGPLNNTMASARALARAA